MKFTDNKAKAALAESVVGSMTSLQLDRDAKIGIDHAAFVLGSVRLAATLAEGDSGQELKAAILERLWNEVIRPEA